MSLVVLVTDTSGFVASHVVKRLLEQGCTVRVTLRKSSSIKDSLKKWGGKLELYEADISETDRLKEIVPGCTHVIHTADLFPDRVNTFTDDKMTRHVVRGLLEACLNDGGVKRVIVTGSCDFAKGTFSKDNYSTKDWVMKDAYCKALTENEALRFVKSPLNAGQKIKLSIIRSPVVMGPIYFPVDKEKVEMVRRLQDNKWARDIHFPMCDVRDVAEAYVVALKDETVVDKCVSVTHQVLSFEGMRDIIKETFDPDGNVFKMKFSSFGPIMNETTNALNTLYGDKKVYPQGEDCRILVNSPTAMKITVRDVVKSYEKHDLINLKTSNQDKE